MSADRKICSTCKEDKPLYLYGKNRREKLGVRSECMACRKEYTKANPIIKYDRQLEGRKICPSCNQSLDVSKFGTSKRHVDGLTSRCKPCNNAYFRKNYWRLAYGMSNEDYNNMLAKQDGKCGICKCTEDEAILKTSRRFVIDHCHTTETVRGILCSSCNSGIGLLGDDVESVKKALDYFYRNDGGIR